MTTFTAFLDQAWSDHGDRPRDVAERLEQGYALIESEDQIAPFARLLAHVDGEHLARWRDGVARLERLRRHPRWSDDGDGPVFVRRLIAALEVASGAAPDPALDAADRAHAHAVAAAAMIAQNKIATAIGHLQTALAAAASGLPERDPAVRALAVAANNLAAALEEKSPRDAGETVAMLAAARASREFWARAGTWLETQRAEYVLAKCHLAAGDAPMAQDHAAQCAAICERHGADAFERFFAQSVLALANRACGNDDRHAHAKAAALAQYARLEAGQSPSCESTLRLLT